MSYYERVDRVISARPSPALAYLVLAVIGLQSLLRIGAPGFAAWSFEHAHLSVDGRAHAHVHPWDRGALSGGSQQPDGPARTVSVPSSEVSSAVVALPAAIVLIALSGAFFVANSLGAPAYRGVVPLPVTPPPRG